MKLIRTETCQVCGQASVVAVSDEGYEKWKAGAFVQDAFPELAAGARELLISGTHPECWDVLFADDEEDDW